MIRFYGLIFGTLAIIAVAVGGYFYIKGIQKDLEHAKVELSKVNIAYEQQALVFSNMQKQIEQQKIERAELQKQLISARSKSAETKKVFAKHNLEAIAKKKPGLLEKRMRQATSQIFAELEFETQ